MMRDLGLMLLEMSAVFSAFTRSYSLFEIRGAFPNLARSLSHWCPAREQDASWTIPFYITASLCVVDAAAWLAIDPNQPVEA